MPIRPISDVHGQDHTEGPNNARVTLVDTEILFVPIRL